MLTFEKMKAKVEASGFLLLTLESEYKNTRTLLKVQCPCGQIVFKMYSNTKKQSGCKYCFSVKSAASRRLSEEEIRKAFEARDFTFLSISDRKIKYLCARQHESLINWGDFQQGHGCMRCRDLDRAGVDTRKTVPSGEQHWNWNPDAEERDSAEYDKWVQIIWARDNFTCQKCKARKQLNAHHIRNYASYAEGRFDVDNGITLCELCHERFHQLYSKERNDRSQIDEFLANFLM